MYSGLVLTKYSGRLMGAHQKIDKVARRHLSEIIGEDDAKFPSFKEILQFEGKNGPDGIKRKSPSYNEPWHFINPLADDNSEFMKLLTNHYEGLVRHLKSGNREGAAFEASWLAHTIVDGLTPAHHYPYDEKLAEMLVDGKAGRNSIKDKLIFKGATKTDTFKNTFRVYGPNGFMTSHVVFEQGINMIIKPLRLPDARPKEKDFIELEQEEYVGYFMHRAREVAVLGLFDLYLKSGWTSKLSNQIRHALLPNVVKSVTMLWYSAAKEAGL